MEYLGYQLELIKEVKEEHTSYRPFIDNTSRIPDEFFPVLQLPRDRGMTVDQLRMYIEHWYNQPIGSSNDEVLYDWTLRMAENAAYNAGVLSASTQEVVYIDEEDWDHYVNNVPRHMGDFDGDAHVNELDLIEF